MINFLSSWAEQIVLAVIIATIIELILPNSKNKKYVQMVIGVYVLFNIISPIIKNKDVFIFEEINLDDYTNSSNISSNTSTNIDSELEKIYLEEMEKEIKSKFEDGGITVSKCTIEAELDSSKSNAGISSIAIKIKDSADKEKINKIKQEILEEYEIDESKLEIVLN